MYFDILTEQIEYALNQIDKEAPLRYGNTILFTKFASFFYESETKKIILTKLENNFCNTIACFTAIITINSKFTLQDFFIKYKYKTIVFYLDDDTCGIYLNLQHNVIVKNKIIRVFIDKT
jgi:hypothetical protein